MELKSVNDKFTIFHADKVLGEKSDFSESTGGLHRLMGLLEEGTAADLGPVPNPRIALIQTGPRGTKETDYPYENPLLRRGRKLTKKERARLARLQKMISGKYIPTEDLDA